MEEQADKYIGSEVQNYDDRLVDNIKTNLTRRRCDGAKCI